jgi:hypothetical protein
MMITICCLAGLTLTTGRAGAAVSSEPLRTTFGTVLTKVDGSRAAAALPDTIHCGGYISNPYQSGGAVRVDVHGECTAVVDNIYLSPAIYYSNGANVAERPENFPSTSAADRFAVTNCLGIDLEYFGYGLAIFTKAGYAGSPLVMSGRTPNVAIFC